MPGIREKRRKFGNVLIFAAPGIAILFLAALTAGLVIPACASAEEGWGPGQDKWKFALGGFFPSTNTELKINGVNPGDLIDLEDTLGFNDSDNLFRLDGYWRFFKRHRLDFGYYKFNRDASTGLSRDISIGDVVFPVDASVASELDIGFYTLDYMYSFYQGEKLEIAGGLGAYWVDFAFSVSAALNVNGEPILGGPFYENTDFSGPLPYLILSFEYYITPKWLAIIRGGYFKANIDNIDGTLTTLGARLEYQFTRTFGLGIGYDGFKIKADTDDHDLHTELEYEYKGFQAYGILRF